ncbi:hypothetical protein CesoFtcFv8_026986 [Champsocephalus esox]|uniref:Uncharacterized protein n=1 Tax=Champsocephalus esox TaxID=159716 RepID=A0AAN8G894_9TELE|nr:hypothetical protein CesoFtcFv8_026986 [Champsocephalus esox]
MRAEDHRELRVDLSDVTGGFFKLKRAVVHEAKPTGSDIDDIKSLTFPEVSPLLTLCPSAALLCQRMMGGSAQAEGALLTLM